MYKLTHLLTYLGQENNKSGHVLHNSSWTVKGNGKHNNMRISSWNTRWLAFHRICATCAEV